MRLPFRCFVVPVSVLLFLCLLCLFETMKSHGAQASRGSDKIKGRIRQETYKHAFDVTRCPCGPPENNQRAGGGVRREARVQDIPPLHTAARCSFLSLNGRWPPSQRSDWHHHPHTPPPRTRSQQHPTRTVPVPSHSLFLLSHSPPQRPGTAQSAQIISRRSDG